MNRPLASTLVEDGHHDLVQRETTQALILTGQERVQDLIHESMLSLKEVLAEVHDTICGCEAEFEVTEDVSVIIEQNRAVFNVKRSTRLAKDKP